MGSCIYWSVSACLPAREEKDMCDTIWTKEEVERIEIPPHTDVDDLIFCDEKEWLVSDR